MTTDTRNTPETKLMTQEHQHQPNDAQLLDQVLNQKRVFTVNEIDIMANRVAKSGLFGFNQDQTFALMLLCEADGLHPAQAMRMYHLIQNRPSMRAEAMLAKFIQVGGHVRWITESNDIEKCEAMFSHPSHCPEGKLVTFTMADAERAGLPAKNENWRKFPANQLRARVTSNGIRMICPGIVVGIYTPEEVQDLDQAIPSQSYRIDQNTKGYTSVIIDTEADLTYDRWVKEFVNEVNGKWLEHVTDKKTGEVKGITEIVTSDQVLDHFLFWAQAEALLTPRDMLRLHSREQRILFIWKEHGASMKEEAALFARDLWRKTKEKRSSEAKIDANSEVPEKLPSQEIKKFPPKIQEKVSSEHGSHP